MDMTTKRRAIVESPLEALNMARDAGGPVAVCIATAAEPVYATVGPAGEWRNDDDIEHAVRLAATVGHRQGWTVYEFSEGVYVTGSPYATGRYMTTDDEAIRLAIAAGVRCDADGRID